MPALLDSTNCEGKNPSNDCIEEGVVADGAVKGDIHWKECGKRGCGECYFLAAQPPDSGEIDAEQGCEPYDGIEKSEAKSGSGVSWVGTGHG